MQAKISLAKFYNRFIVIYNEEKTMKPLKLSLQGFIKGKIK